MVNFSVKYGARIRKRYYAVRKEKSSVYRCPSCGTDSVRRKGTGIWECRHCNNVYAGGAYQFSTPAGEAARRLIEGAKNK
ncbi:MAG: 50S ribosomal protein L37ae [Candidatus Marsarchaeota archaeon]|jgi:large subunit ribosomal protein L37Ae|nr:50S ribosomal protein L37ae [Candidatus Marsarchaeota archaeon]MCL5431411.1 50S ribosomal protein L37ae [Candidatus Marsarchaeota archaeon]